MIISKLLQHIVKDEEMYVKHLWPYKINIIYDIPEKYIFMI